MSRDEFVIVERYWVCPTCGAHHVQWSDCTSVVCPGCNSLWEFVGSVSGEVVE